ncbi:MAG: hypothetical protein WA091_01760 [Minisyncoccales bacterium]
MKTQTLILICLWVAVLFVPFIILADTDTDTDSTIASNDITETIENITKWITNICLAVAILMYVLGGYFWIIDNGNMESVKMAKSIIISATIGLAIILIANSLVSIVKTLVVTND